MTKEAMRPFGILKVWPEGYNHFDKGIQRVLGIDKIKKRDELNYFIVANCILITRKDVIVEQLLEALDVLKLDLKLRTFHYLFEIDKGRVALAEQVSIPKT